MIVLNMVDMVYLKPPITTRNPTDVLTKMTTVVPAGKELLQHSPRTVLMKMAMMRI